MEIATVKIRWADGTRQKIWVPIDQSDHGMIESVAPGVVADLVLSVGRAILTADGHLPEQESIYQILASYLAAWRDQPGMLAEPIYVGSMMIEVEFSANSLAT